MPDDESETTDTTDSTRVKYLPEFFLSVQQGILQVQPSWNLLPFLSVHVVLERGMGMIYSVLRIAQWAFDEVGERMNA